MTTRLIAEGAKLYLNGIMLIIELNNIDIFEKNYKIRINIYNFNLCSFLYPLRINQAKFETHINLLPLTHEKRIIFS